MFPEIAPPNSNRVPDGTGFGCPRERVSPVKRLCIVAILFPVAISLANAQSVNPSLGGGTFVYRGFAVDVSAVPNFATIKKSIEHQIDIVADCAAKSKVMSFFRGQKISLETNLANEGGIFDPNRGVVIDAVVQPPQRPILLHELLHAFHAYMLPRGINNPDVLLYYSRAEDYRLYPANEYVLSNAKEFFAVTASLYLWGNVDREPHTRKRLKAQQPFYYEWLGQLFGVGK